MSLKDIRPALRTHLAANGAVAALVVAGGTTHIYAVKLPQNVKRDAISYQEISGQGDHHNEGASGLVQVRMQISSWSKTPAGAHALFLAVKEAIDGYRGSMGSGAEEVDVQGVFIDSWRDLYDDGSELFGKVADYFIHYGER